MMNKMINKSSKKITKSIQKAGRKRARAKAKAEEKAKYNALSKEEKKEYREQKAIARAEEQQAKAEREAFRKAELKEERDNLKRVIKNTNRRINRIAETWGTDSAVYRKEEEYLLANYREFVVYNERGEIQIAEPAKLIDEKYGKNAQAMRKASQALTRNVHTVDQLKERARRQFEEQGLTEYSDEDLIDMTETLRESDERFETYKDIFYDAREMWQNQDAIGITGFNRDTQNSFESAYDKLKRYSDGKLKGKYTEKSISEFKEAMSELNGVYDSVKAEFNAKVKANAQQYKRPIAHTHDMDRSLPRDKMRF